MKKLVIPVILALLCVFFVLSAISLDVSTPSMGGQVLTNNYNITFNFTPSYSGSANVTITWHNGTSNVINSSSNAVTPYTYVFDTSTQGDSFQKYNLTILVMNGSNASDNASIIRYNLTIDNDPPSVNLLNTSFNTTNSTPSVSFNYTDVASPNTTCTIYFNGTGSGTNGTVLNNTNTVLIASTQDDGSYVVYINCTDLGGNEQNSSNITVGVDAYAPVLSVNLSNGSDVPSTYNLTGNAPDAGSFLSVVRISINGTYQGNATINNTSWNYTVTGGEGNVHNVTINATDANGNSNLTTIYNITLDDTPPVISAIDSGDPDTTQATITWTTNEPANSTINRGTSTSLGLRQGSATLVTSHSVNLNNLQSGTTYYYNVTSCDEAGNCNTSGPNQFTTDTSSGGSTSGGGSSTSTPTLSSSPIQTIISTAGRYSFQGPDKKIHDITVVDLGTDSATLRIESDPIEVTLNVGESTEVDITGDGELDLYVSLVSVGATTATIKVGAPQSTDADDSDDDTDTGDDTDDTPTQSNETTDEDLDLVDEPPAPVEEVNETEEPGDALVDEVDKKGSLWVWVLIGLILIFGILFWWAVESRHIEFD